MSADKIILTAKLLQVRLASINGVRKPRALPADVKKMLVELSVQVKPHKEKSDGAIATVILDAFGVPDDDESRQSSLFDIRVEMRGVYQFAEVVKPEQFQEDALNQILALPIYTLAAKKARELADDFGFSITLPADLRVLIADATIVKERGGEKNPAARKTSRKPRSKPKEAE